ncbi:MAG: hypothetical protein PUH24_06805 [Prevotellaceae bacterium]|nr:hypothetical protein [Prevotella sp.]MDD7257957.1 hypothetical protein [Prevotellaceae bacterium]MDY6129806.1 hypothetical protein [Prevotella sp.]
MIRDITCYDKFALKHFIVRIVTQHSRNYYTYRHFVRHKYSLSPNNWPQRELLSDFMAVFPVKENVFSLLNWRVIQEFYVSLHSFLEKVHREKAVACPMAHGNSIETKTES